MTLGKLSEAVGPILRPSKSLFGVRMLYLKLLLSVDSRPPIFSLPDEKRKYKGQVLNILKMGVCTYSDRDSFFGRE